MRKIVLLCVLVLPIVFCYAQAAKQVEDGLFKVNALLPGVSYEFGVGNASTISLEGIVGFALNGGSGRSTEFGIFPAVQAEYRNYVNFERRLGKNKNISGNSGNYVSLLNQFQLGNPLFGDLEFNSDYYYNLAIVYGIQRIRPQGFYWGVSFGPGVFIDDFGTDVGLLIDVRLGWVVGGRKNK